MAQIFWEQIRDLLPNGGEYLTGSLTVSGSFGTSGSIYYNGQLLEDFVDARALSASTDYDQLTNIPANIFSGSFLAGPNITINQTGQTVEISGSAATSYTSLTDIPAFNKFLIEQPNFFKSMMVLPELKAFLIDSFVQLLIFFKAAFISLALTPAFRRSS